jgi:hypothetical protein
MLGQRERLIILYRFCILPFLYFIRRMSETDIACHKKLIMLRFFILQSCSMLSPAGLCKLR